MSLKPERTSAVVQEGEVVILYSSPESLETVYATPGDIFNNRFGAFYHDDILGKRWGTKITSRDKGSWMYALEATPELWSRSLAHRTQIIYSMDASVISFQMDLRPGCVMVESGTGSGSLSHHFARCVMPTGHLHTFEFNATRAEAAREEFKRNGIAPYATVRHRDVCSGGFQVEGGALDGKADAVFLDLPAPWLAVPHAHKALKADGAVCSFSPCIEQVARTCAALRSNGFNRLYTCEALVKPFTVFSREVEMPPCSSSSSSNAPPAAKRRRTETRPMSTMKGHTSFLTFARKVPLSETEDEIDMARREAEEKKEQAAKKAKEEEEAAKEEAEVTEAAAAATTAAAAAAAAAAAGKDDAADVANASAASSVVGTSTEGK